MFKLININKIKKYFYKKTCNNDLTIVQILGLCPLLSVSSSTLNSIGLGIIITLVIFFTNIIVSMFKYWIPKEIRTLIYIIIIASIVSIIQMLINAYAFNLYKSLDTFIPLIVTNCIIIDRVETYASKNNIYHSGIDGLLIGMNTTITLFFLGAIREIIGNGTLFNDTNLLLGKYSKILRIEIIHFNYPFLLAILPPGAFIGLGLILAIKYLINKNIKHINKK
ncbi:MAG: electron transport complex subunit E [Arsenophonus endosymbiont of Ceratovacuna japonica]